MTDAPFDLGERIAATVARKQARQWAALQPAPTPPPDLTKFDGRLRAAVAELSEGTEDAAV